MFMKYLTLLVTHFGNSGIFPLMGEGGAVLAPSIDLLPLIEILKQEERH